MKEEIKEIVGDTRSKICDTMIKCLKKQNRTPEEIANELESFSTISRESLHMIALIGNDKVMSDRIGEALKILKQRKVAAFYQAEQDGTLSEFLGAMSWEDKSLLKGYLGLTSWDDKPLTKKQQYYLDIIQQSIEASIEQEAKEQGFESVEAWREHQNEMANKFRSQHPKLFRPRVGRAWRF